MQVVITHASHVCSQLSFGLPLKMNGMHRTQFDHVRLDILSLVILSRETYAKHSAGGAKAFWPSIVRDLKHRQRNGLRRRFATEADWAKGFVFGGENEV